MGSRTIGSHVVMILAASLVGGLVGAAVFLLLEWSSPATIEIAPLTPGDIVVEVRGEVADPGLKTLPVGARLAEAIESAGGLLPDADVSRLNLAARLGDGEIITIPAHVPTPPPGGSPVVAADPGLVNINTASVVQLQELPGIGPVIAQRIVDFREFYGPFTSVDQLDEVNGISLDMVEELTPLVTVGG